MMHVTVAICTWNRVKLLDRTLTRMRQLRLPDALSWERMEQAAGRLVLPSPLNWCCTRAKCGSRPTRQRGDAATRRLGHEPK